MVSNNYCFFCQYMQNLRCSGFHTCLIKKPNNILEIFVSFVPNIALNLGSVGKSKKLKMDIPFTPVPVGTLGQIFQIRWSAGRFCG